MLELADFLDIGSDMLFDRRHSSAAFAAYKPIILQLSRGKSVLEIGAGRNPLFSPAELAAENIAYSANDIAQSELNAMLHEVPRFAFDASQHVPGECLSRFDVIFSKMVQEHVQDTLGFYRNIALMLKPGGIALNFHPVLYALPFVVNKLMPESWSDPLLYRLRKDRNKERSPKFPAVYDHCTVSETVRQRIRDCGFAHVRQIAFYGHGYYKSLPLVRDAHRRFTDYAMGRDLTTLASFSYTLCMKAPARLPRRSDPAMEAEAALAG
jgi:SAM-dependent methyltransferase